MKFEDSDFLKLYTFFFCVARVVAVGACKTSSVLSFHAK